MDFLLNEKSLFGQFQDESEFLSSLHENLKCFEFVHFQEEGRIWKIADFYKCRITEAMTLGDLKRLRTTDSLLRLRLALDKITDREPYWDDEPVHDYGDCYLMDQEDVTATSVAEAAERREALLSFYSEKYCDRELKVRKGERAFTVHSIYSPRYLAEHFGRQMGLDGDICLKARYTGTRLDCTLLEARYGTRILEPGEYELLVGTLDKFVRHPSWESIGLDDGLEYKKYSPGTEKDDWFHNTPYKDQTIMKFRFSRKMRCYGYRKGDKFRLLRLERDHKESDQG